MTRDIAAVIAAALALGCAPDTASCENVQRRPYDVTEDLSAADLDHIAQSDGTVRCKDACEVGLVIANEYVSMGKVASCALEIDASWSAGDGSNQRLQEYGGTVSCSGKGPVFCLGRRPAGHVEQEGAGTDGLGALLGTLAHLEAASVDAFRELAAQLRAWGAPGVLVGRCEEAARDEVHHAALLTAEAEARGADVPVPQRAPSPDGLRDAALLNATEGCVHETLAALLAHPLADHAPSVRLRAAFATIAGDETRHGQLAWDLHRWFLTQLDVDTAQEVAEAQRQALARLPEIAQRQAQGLSPLGGPSPAQALRLGEALAHGLAA